MVVIKRDIEPYERQKAKERMLSGKPSEYLSEGNALDKIAGFVGVSRNTLKKTENMLNRQNNNQKYINYLFSSDHQIHFQSM
jgi:hypothetical protein